MQTIWKVTLDLSYEYEDETFDGGCTSVNVAAATAEDAIAAAKRHEGDGTRYEPTEAEDGDDDLRPYDIHAKLSGVEKLVTVDCVANK